MTKLTSAILLNIFLCLGCAQIENSSAMDSLYYSESAGSEKFVEASIVLKKYCLQCHTYAGYGEEELKTARGRSGLQLVQIGNLQGSPVYSRIRGNSVNTTGNMPPTGSVPSDELSKIKDWIEGL